ncbi:MAG: SRPBCC family protein [Pseudomonadota bacterium]
MKFSTREDIDRPIEDAFDAAADFTLFERLAARRGVSMAGSTSIKTLEVGQSWKSRFDYRGKDRLVEAEVISCDPGQGYAVSFFGEGIEGLGVVDFLELSKDRTRMFVSLDMHPKTIAARVILQSLKFAKRTLNARFKKRVTAFARLIEDGHPL